MYFLNIFNNLLINILLFVLIYLIKSEEEFNFNIGNLNLFCPEPKENWHSVGTGCFKKIFKKFNWTVANEFCQNFENNSSNSLFLDNFLLYKELSKVLNKEFSGSFEFWTSWYIKLNNSKELPERIFKFNSTYSISIYNPNWALLQPQFEEFLNDKENILCISWNSMLSDKENFGWRLRNCSELLLTICQTFPCFLDSNKHPQHRCSDNSGCISVYI
uniref:C-type lectin domain-containing protein n=1 Tax=Meloidogyne enterolobii TaxID=390850 RepID=A0A6V7VR09_MELEN|nr:unnamed protein product [Meloidogyne enterolobii]